MAQARSKSTMVQQVVLGAVLVMFGLTEPTMMLQQKRSRWQTIKVEDLLTFQLPNGWSRSLQKLSDLRGEWKRGDAKLLYIQGQTESGLYSERIQSWMRDYEETTTKMGGQKANVRSFSFMKDAKRRYVAELNIGNWDKNQIQFYMRVEGGNGTILELAKEIFKSVSLSLPPPERSYPQ